ncbi:hypothetical protein BJV78DRAFT_1164406, partial [Lactifluus subvellereus]
MPPKLPVCFFFFFFLLLTFSFFYCNSYSDYNTMQRHKLNPKKSSSSTRRSGNLAHTWPLTAQCSDRPRGGCMRLDTSRSHPHPVQA